MLALHRHAPRMRGLHDYRDAPPQAITQVEIAKGYSLVGCSIAGVNASFVRNNLLDDKFPAPFTAENHHQPARYFLEAILFRRSSQTAPASIRACANEATE